MRRNIKIPRILKINRIKGLSISVVFNNGESRIVDFKKVFKKLEINNDSPIMILKDSDEFAKVELKNNTLSWSNVEQFITDKNSKKVKVPFENGADVCQKQFDCTRHPQGAGTGKRLHHGRTFIRQTETDQKVDFQDV